MSALASLSLRERVLLIGGGLLVTGLMAWQFAWQPIQAERAALEVEIERYLMLAQVADEIGPAGTTAQDGTSLPLAQRITRSAQGAGVPIARLDPSGARLRVAVEQVGFDALLGWLQTLEQDEAARAVTLEVERLTEPGVVTARLTLEDAR